jgi:uncharacterized membrane protein SpoIIM required for sporulation
MSEEETHQELIPQSRPSTLKELLGRRRFVLILVVLLVELTIFFVATSVPIDAATQQALQNEAKNLTAASNSSSPTGQLVQIFTHNAAIAFGEIVPVVGGLLWVVSIYATGQIIQAVALSHGAPGLLYGLVLLIFPFAIVEMAAYAVAVSSGLMLIIAWRRHRLRDETRVLVLEAGAVAAILLTAAVMETVTSVNPVLGIALWIPTGFTTWALALISARARN